MQIKNCPPRERKKKSGGEKAKKLQGVHGDPIKEKYEKRSDKTLEVLKER